MKHMKWYTYEVQTTVCLPTITKIRSCSQNSCSFQTPEANNNGRLAKTLSQDEALRSCNKNDDRNLESYL